MNSQIVNLLTAITNAKTAGKTQLATPFSNYKKLLLEVLQEEGFIESFTDDKRTGKLIIKLVPAIRSFEKIKAISKPSRKIYVKSDKIPRSKKGAGVVIISTPKGVMTDKKARKAGVGGEIICEVF